MKYRETKENTLPVALPRVFPTSQALSVQQWQLLYTRLPILCMAHLLLWPENHDKRPEYKTIKCSNGGNKYV
jgi:hypothetical protein